MPELPEVETVRRSLLPVILHKTIETVELRYERILQHCSPQVFQEKLMGNRFLDLVRRGKYLIFSLEDELELVAHLRMTGRLIFYSDCSIPMAKHLGRLCFGSENAPRFERAQIWHLDAGEKGSMTRLRDSRAGVEPLSPSFTQASLQALTAKARPRSSSAPRSKKNRRAGEYLRRRKSFLAGLHRNGPQAPQRSRAEQAPRSDCPSSPGCHREPRDNPPGLPHRLWPGRILPK